MGMVFDIKRYALHDGPGIRLTVFFKGCPLRCRWCHNPESVAREPELMINAAKCIGCGTCVRACPRGAFRLGDSGPAVDAEVCQRCGECVAACPTRAVEMVGEEMSVAQVIEVAEKDRVLIEQSGGGITCSGGEPLLQPAFLMELLDAAGAARLHRAVDTSGLCDSKNLLAAADRAELFLFDLKATSAETHLAWTGVDNAPILHNLRLLAATGAAIEIRMPLIDGVNCDDAAIDHAATLVQSLDGEPKTVALLPYHNLAGAKCAKLGTTHDASGMGEPSEKTLERIIQQFAARNLSASIGG